jgi:hypothetical protein
MHQRTRRSWTAVLGLGVAVLAAQGLAVAPAAATTIPAGSVEVKTALSPFSLGNKTQRVNCPAGKVALGGGSQTSGGPHLVITEARPISDPAGNGFVVTAQVDQVGVTSPWTVTVFAFCAVAPPGYEVIPQVNPPTTAFSDAALARCSAGKNAIGSGGQITGGNGQVNLTMGPNNLSGVASASGAEAAEDADGFAGNYQLTAYAICARQNVFFDFQIASDQTLTDSMAVKRLTVTCPSGYRATAGAFSGVGLGANLLFFRPNVLNAPASIDFAASAPPTSTGIWNLSGVVFCAR